VSRSIYEYWTIRCVIELINIFSPFRSVLSISNIHVPMFAASRTTLMNMNLTSIKGQFLMVHRHWAVVEYKVHEKDCRVGSVFVFERSMNFLWRARWCAVVIMMRLVHFIC